MYKQSLEIDFLSKSFISLNLVFNVNTFNPPNANTGVVGWKLRQST